MMRMMSSVREASTETPQEKVTLPETSKLDYEKLSQFI
jgi:hypothetical protein